MRIWPLLLLAMVACSDGKEAKPAKPEPTAVRHAGLELSVTVSGAVIDAALTNVGERPLTILSAVTGPDRIHYDGFWAWIGTRQFRFTGARNTSETGLIELKSGETVHHPLDLADWSTAVINPGGPLQTGRYEVKLKYETNAGGAWWTGELELDGIEIHVQ